MRKKMAIALALAALFTLSAGSAAFAADYPPNPRTVPSLGGSSVESGCTTADPTIAYSVELTDPSGVVADRAASLVITAGSNSTTIPLGTLGSSGTLSGSVAWPSAAWTRGAVTATIVVDPAQLAVPLSYPTGCSGVASGAASAGLAATGASAAIVPLAIAGGVLTVVGLGIVLRRRSTRV